MGKVHLNHITRERSMVREAPKTTWSAAPDALAPAFPSAHAPLRASCPTQLSVAESATEVVRSARVATVFHAEVNV